MSQQGEPERRAEDMWWQQLYGAYGQPGHGPAPRQDSVDEHFADIRTVMDGPSAQGPSAQGPQAPGGGDGSASRRGGEAGTGDAGGRSEGKGSAGAGRPDPRSGMGLGGAAGPGGRRGVTPGESPGAPGPRTPTPWATAPQDGPVAGGPDGADADAGGTTADPGGRRSNGRESGGRELGDGAAHDDTMPGDTVPDMIVQEGSAPGPTPSAPRPTLRLRTLSRDSGLERTDDPPDPPDHVGDRPPTYAAEPTSWPAADPEDLDALTPDTVLDGGQYGLLTVRAASVRGDSARFRGEPRKDAMLAARFGDGDSGLLLMATATGARTADESHRAARDACRWIASAVGRHSARLAFDIREARRGSLKSGLHRLTGRCLGQLRLRAGELGHEPEDYTAALRCLLLPVDPECRTRVFFGVGEGGLFRLREGEWQDLDPALDQDKPEFVAGQRSEHGKGDGAQPAQRFRFRASVGVPGDVLLLCTPGMAEPLRGEPALAELLAERWAGEGAPPGLASFLKDAQVRAKGYADDRTAVAAWEA